VLSIFVEVPLLGIGFIPECQSVLHEYELARVYADWDTVTHTHGTHYIFLLVIYNSNQEFKVTFLNLMSKVAG